MGALSQLAKRMDDHAIKLESVANNAAVEVAISVVADLVLKTPVDTSNAASNWQVGVNNAPTASITPYFYGSNGSTAGASGRAARVTARDVLSRKKAGQPIFISNLVDYIEKLNKGSSKQEPAGFVQRAVLVGRVTLKKIKSRVW